MDEKRVYPSLRYSKMEEVYDALVDLFEIIKSYNNCSAFPVDRDFMEKVEKVIKDAIDTETTIPPLTQRPLRQINLTPDPFLAVRILKVFRDDCNCKWASNSDGIVDSGNTVMADMNKICDERVVILDRAISILEGNIVNKDDGILGGK